MGVTNSPWYLIDPRDRLIRVYHGDLDKTWWKRGTSPGEMDVRKVEDIIRAATGLQRVTRIHDRDVVEFRIRKDLFDRAAVALRMSIPETSEELHQFLRRWKKGTQ